MRGICSPRRVIWAGLLLGMLSCGPAYGYIGPGAGFAVTSSFLALFVAGLLAFVAILAWPFRAAVTWFRGRNIRAKRKVRRVVILGLDGLDPRLADRLMAEGKLPHFDALRRNGTFRPLQTTTPAISPVAWSTFATGVNPGKHRIFDFYTRDPNNYLPVLSSVRISSYQKRVGFGSWRLARRKVDVRFLRKSASFWTILGDHGVFCHVLRVPITFPPEKMHGVCLASMCTPDLRGTQGTFTLFSTGTADAQPDISVGGTRVALRLVGDMLSAEITGPTIEAGDSSRTLTIPLTGRLDRDARAVDLHVGEARVRLREKEYSPWIKLNFRMGWRTSVKGIAKFLLTQIEPDLRIYMTPIHLDPERPALPISHPAMYATGLTKLYGPFATLGLAEDTWALNAGVIDEAAFLQQTYDIYEERRRQLMDSLERNRNGLVAAVFDTTDRIQHMFFRHLDGDHPANGKRDGENHRDVIERLYVKMDDLVAEVGDKLGPKDVLMVVSDHGFESFKWGINLNSWLRDQGYLVLKDGATLDAEWFANVDWSKTRAYAYGLGGMFLNLVGREKFGIVEQGEGRKRLIGELKRRLTEILDEKRGQRPIRRVLAAEEVLRGPYVGEAPDLFIGYERGYRASWNSAIGKITTEVVEDNVRPWSGDHCIDPELVPGVFFCNWHMSDAAPSLMDLAPTVLGLFGVARPAYHDGRYLDLRSPEQGPATENAE